MDASGTGQHVAGRVVLEMHSIDGGRLIDENHLSGGNCVGKNKGRFAHGQCETCGGQISRVRLDAIPFTTYCVNCERRYEEKSEMSP